MRFWGFKADLKESTTYLSMIYIIQKFSVVNENILYKTHNLARWKIPANTPSVSMPQIEKLTEKGN